LHERLLVLSGYEINSLEDIGQTGFHPGFSLVDESVAGGRPADELLGPEPEGDFLLGGLDRVRTVDDVAPEVEAEVAADRTRQRRLRIGFAHHHSACLGRVLSLPDHRDDWAGRHEVAETVVKWFILEIDVVLFQVFFGTLHELHGDELESPLFESLNDVADQTALDAVGFHHDEGTLRVSGHFQRLPSRGY